jgi:hypothetical protein
MNLQQQEQTEQRESKFRINNSDLNNPYTASVGDSPLFSDAAICSEDLRPFPPTKPKAFRFSLTLEPTLGRTVHRPETNK